MEESVTVNPGLLVMLLIQKLRPEEVTTIIQHNCQLEIVYEGDFAIHIIGEQSTFSLKATIVSDEWEIGPVIIHGANFGLAAPVL